MLPGVIMDFLSAYVSEIDMFSHCQQSFSQYRGRRAKLFFSPNFSNCQFSSAYCWQRKKEECNVIVSKG